MRVKDDEKIAALFEATVKKVNEIGFASSSVSKIAKEAGVSPATIYVYYKNKDELLVSTYVEIKRRISAALLDSFDESEPVRDIFEKFFLKFYEFIVGNADYYKYTEQFANSPYSELVDREALERFFEPIFRVYLHGVEQKILKNVDIPIVTAFIWAPVVALANPNSCHGERLEKNTIETAFTLAWDAIKL